MTGPLVIDDLSYTYHSVSNRLKMVLDATNSSQGFTDNANATATDIDFRYDELSNMIADNNKGITSIKYNHLNLPTEIIFNNNAYKKITYLYNAIGEKVHKSIIYLPVISNTYDYCDGFQYRNNLLSFFPTSEGYVSNMLTAEFKDYYGYIFNYTDHLGNVRLSYSKDPSTGLVKTLEENHYYPFGLKHTGYNNNLSGFQTGGVGMELMDKTMPIPGHFLYDYKFEGREWQDELGLNVYPFKYRTYDPAIGRFWSIDPIAESYVYNSTYAFAENRVVESIDLEGRESWYTQDGSLATKAGPYTSAAKKQLNLYSPSEVQQMRAKPDSNPKGPTFSQDRMTTAERKQHDSGIRSQIAAKEHTQNTIDNHDNLGSPYTQLSVMTGAAYGAADVVTGELIGKAVQGAKLLITGSKAEEATSVYRVFGGDTKAEGFSWTTENPNNVSNFRNAAGLPSGGESGATNTGQFVIEGTVKNENIIRAHPASPLDGNKGGLPELKINPNDVQIKRVSGVNPEF